MTIASALVGRLALCDRGSDTDTHRQRFWYHVNARPTRPPTEPMPTADKWRAEGRLEKRAAPGVWQPRVALVAGERLYVARRRQAAMADVQLAMRAYDLSHAKMSVTTHVGDRQATVVSMTMRAGNGKPLKARLRGPAAIERFAHVLVHWAKSADTRAVLDAHIKFAYVLDRRHTQAIDEDKSTITASNSDELETLQAPSATGANAKPVALPSAIKVTSMTPEMQAEVAEDKRQRQMVTSAPCVLPSTVATHEEIMQDITSSTSIATDGDPCHEIFSQCLLKMCPDRIALKSSSSVGSNTATDTIEMATDTVDDFASQTTIMAPAAMCLRSNTRTATIVSVDTTSSTPSALQHWLDGAASSTSKPPTQQFRVAQVYSSDNGMYAPRRFRPSTGGYVKWKCMQKLSPSACSLMSLTPKSERPSLRTTTQLLVDKPAHEQCHGLQWNDG